MAEISSDSEDLVEIVIDDEEEFVYPESTLGTEIVEDESDEPLVVSESTDVTVIEATSRGPAGPSGEDGQDGEDGQSGIDGENGREIELQKSSTHIQWRYVGDATWLDLVPLVDLTGPPGEDGEDGTDGGTFASGMPKAGTVNLGVPGVLLYAANTAAAGTRRDMNNFEVDATLTVNALQIEVVFAGTETSFRAGIIAADKHLQPTGPILASATFTVSTTGTKRIAITPVNLTPGRYLIMHQGQNTGSVTLRSYRSSTNAVISTMGASGLIERYRYTHSINQALDASPWTTVVTGSFGQSHCVMMEYEYV
jgi:hypothetical protein